MGKKVETTSRFRLTVFIVVLAAHAGAIFIPLGVMLWRAEKPKPVAFRVKLGGHEPSHAPEVGPPSRLRPTGSTASSTTAATTTTGTEAATTTSAVAE